MAEVTPRDVWEQLSFAAVESVVETDLDGIERDALVSVPMSAADVAREVVRLYPEFLRETGERGSGDALPIYEVFAQAMVSRMVRWLGKHGLPNADRHALRERLSADISDLASEDRSDERLRELAALDAQFNSGHDLRTDGNLFPWAAEQSLLVTRAARAIHERNQAREFLTMTPAHQRVHTYREAHETKKATAALRVHVDSRFDELKAEIAALRKPIWRQALGPVTIAGAFVAGFFGADGPRWGG